MKTILKLDQHDMGMVSHKDSPLSKTRVAVRAVALDAQGQVALVEFAKLGSPKLPGGGVDEGEELLDALCREVREEIGYEVAEVLAELGSVEEKRYYVGLYQVSLAYLVRLGKFVGSDPTEGELQKGIHTSWHKNIDAAISYITNSPELVDEDGDAIGREMMETRDMAILEAAKKIIVT